MSDNSIAIGINRFVSIHNAVQNAIDDLGVSGEYRRIFIRWAIEADMRIGGIRALEEKAAALPFVGVVLSCRWMLWQYLIKALCWVLAMESVIHVLCLTTIG